MNEFKRFHPLSIVSFMVQGARKSFVILLFWFIRAESLSLIFNVISVSIYLLTLFMISLFKYFSQKYRIGEDKVEIYSGIIKKREKDISYDRIQTVKQRQWFFFKPFGVIEILIETGGSSKGEAEAILPAVPIEIFNQIERFRDGEAQLEVEVLPHYKLSSKVLFLYAITDLNIILYILPILFFVVEIALEIWAEAIDNFASQIAYQSWTLVAGTVFSAMFTLIAFSVAKNFIQYYNFQVTYSRDTLLIEHGLFERKLQSIPIKKIQGIKVYNQVLRSVMKLSSVEIILKGGQETDGEGSLATKLYFLPLVKESEVYDLVNGLIPTIHIEPTRMTFLTKNKLFYFWRFPIIIMVPTSIVLWMISPWLSLMTMIILCILLMLNWLDCKYQGYSDDRLALLCIQNYQGFSKVQTYLQKGKIQSYTVRSSYFLARKQLGHAEFWIKNGSNSEKIGLRFMNQKDIDELMNEVYIYR